MNVVADTNVLVSAFLWEGPPNHILVAAEELRISFYTSPDLLDELADVLSRPRFSKRIIALRTTSEDLVTGYARLAQVVVPTSMTPVVLDDPSDDAVLACALAAHALCIVSGDDHLLRLTHYQSIRIVSPRTFLTHFLHRPSH